jgi:hypothetical protein
MSRDLTRYQKTENEVLARNGILVENLFARRKCLFGVAGSKYRGDLGRLDPIVRATIAIANWYIPFDPLGGREEPAGDTSDGDGWPGP